MQEGQSSEVGLLRYSNLTAYSQYTTQSNQHWLEGGGSCIFVPELRNTTFHFSISHCSLPCLLPRSHTEQEIWDLVFGWCTGPFPGSLNLPAQGHGGLWKVFSSWAQTWQMQTPHGAGLEQAWFAAACRTHGLGQACQQPRASWPASSHRFFSKHRLNKPWFSSYVTLRWRTAQRKHQENDWRETNLGINQVYVPVELLITQGSFMFVWTLHV